MPPTAGAEMASCMALRSLSVIFLPESIRKVTADLDQQQNDRLTKGRPIAAGILHHQPRHADSGGGGEQCLMKRRPDPLYCGDRQHQHQRPQQDHTRKAEDHDLKRSQMPL